MLLIETLLLKAQSTAAPPEGFLYVWGSNASGALGFSDPGPVPSWTVIGRPRVSGPGRLALKSDGTLWFWGPTELNGSWFFGTRAQSFPDPQHFLATPIRVDQNLYLDVSQGTEHVLAVRQNGSLWVWGRGVEGQLGNNDRTNASSPIQIGTSSWTAVSAGYLSSFALRQDGRLFAWGSNLQGCLGDGTVVPRSSPVQIGTSSWTAITTGLTHSLALRQGGSLFAWGNNDYGQVGAPGDVFLVNKISQHAFRHIVAVKNDGTLWTWGRLTDGTPGNLTTFVFRSSPVQIGSNHWIDCDSGSSWSIAIRDNGYLYTWGSNTTGPLGTNDTINRSSPTQIGSSSWTLVSAQQSTASAVRTDGRLFTWGQNILGNLGLNDNINRSSPTQVGTSSWTQVSTGTNAVLAIRQDGRLYAWGSNSRGQLGDGTTLDRSSPVQIGSSQWLAVNQSGPISAAIRQDNTLWFWGNNSVGQLGLGDRINRSSPTQIGTSLWIAVNNIGGYSLGTNRQAAIRQGGDLFSWGENNTGQVGDGTTIARSSPVFVSGNNRALGSFDTGSFSIKNNYFTWGWGSNSYGQLALNDTATRSLPTLIGNSPGSGFASRSSPTQLGSMSWSLIAAGGNQSAAINQYSKLYAWGRGSNGALGLDSTVNQIAPIPVGNSAWTAVTSGARGMFMVLADQSLWGTGLPMQTFTGLQRSSPTQISSSTWTQVSINNGDDALFVLVAVDTSGRASSAGLNAYLGLGSGVILPEVNINPTQLMASTRSTLGVLPSGAQYSSPVQLGTRSWRQISMGSLHALALDTNQTLWSWGLNTYGQLGHNTTISHSSPTQVGSSSWAAVAAGNGASLGVRSDGSLWQWGYDRPVLGSATFRSSPALIGGTSSFVAVAATVGSQWFAIDSAYRLWVWGRNRAGALGLGSDNLNQFVSTPTLMPGSVSWTTVAGGMQTAMALRSDGTLWSWGYAAFGTLGLGSISVSRSSPTQVGTSLWTAIAAGQYHALALRQDGRLFAWGLNHFGQLGDGTNISRDSPVQIGTSSWTAVAAGLQSSMARNSLGSLYAWGFNTAGGLGNDSIVNVSSPVLVGSRSWINIKTATISSSGIG